MLGLIAIVAGCTAVANHTTPPPSHRTARQDTIELFTIWAIIILFFGWSFSLVKSPTGESNIVSVEGQVSNPVLVLKEKEDGTISLSFNIDSGSLE